MPAHALGLDLGALSQRSGRLSGACQIRRRRALLLGHLPWLSPRRAVRRCRRPFASAVDDKHIDIASSAKPVLASIVDLRRIRGDGIDAGCRISPSFEKARRIPRLPLTRIRRRRFGRRGQSRSRGVDDGRGLAGISRDAHRQRTDSSNAYRTPTPAPHPISQRRCRKLDRKHNARRIRH